MYTLTHSFIRPSPLPVTLSFFALFSLSLRVSIAHFYYGTLRYRIRRKQLLHQQLGKFEFFEAPHPHALVFTCWPFFNCSRALPGSTGAGQWLARTHEAKKGRLGSHQLFNGGGGGGGSISCPFLYRCVGGIFLFIACRRSCGSFAHNAGTEVDGHGPKFPSMPTSIPLTVFGSNPEPKCRS
jgi:hypothetical protein